MARPRLAVLLPTCGVIVTSALWWVARTEYLRFACRPIGDCHGWIGWTDYTPFPIRVAGMLNVPVAIFGTPLYSLLEQTTGTSELTVLLIGVGLLWTYIGSILDARKEAPRSKSVFRSVVGVLGILFGVFLLVVSIPMYHVGVLYNVVSLIWVFVIVRHFLRFFRNPPASSRLNP
jgi:hypothetical protein